MSVSTREILTEIQRPGSARDHYEHGGAYDRGSADRYYGRGFEPHYYEGATYSSERVEITNQLSVEYAAYERGYNEQTEEKDWG